MKSLLQQLENNEAILLMYLAGELPDADRAEVEEMLARDPAMRLALEELGALHSELADALCRDEAHAAARRDAVTRRLVPELEKYAGARRSAPVEIKPSRPLVLRRLLYPLAAAAMILLAVMLWRNHQPAPNTPGMPVPPAIAANLPEIFRNESSGELKDLEEEMVRLASTDDDALGFRTLNRQ